jgi:two-component system LytT family response regulator
MIRTVIADDEPLAREGIRVRLKAEPDVEIAGEAVDGMDAVDVIRSVEPDLVFLDVQMPGADGFEVVRRLDDAVPLIVFVTAYDQHAVRAFETHALDYLLKPFTSRRFREAMERARATIAQVEELDFHRRLVALLDARGAAGASAAAGRTGREDRHLQRFSVKDGERFLLLKTGEVDWIESAGNYVRLHARRGAYMVRMTLSELEAKLDPERFARIHRTAIVNLDRVKQIDPAWHGDFEIRLDTGRTLRLSRSYRDRVLR